MKTANRNVTPVTKRERPQGRTLDEVRYKLDKEASEATGIDFCKVTTLLEAGALNLNDLTDDILRSPTFKYEPYQGFQPKPAHHSR
jgi:hypothetical protein